MSQGEQKVEGTVSEITPDLLIELGLERLRAVGIVLLILGVLALISPAVAGTAVSLIAGLVLLGAGVWKGVQLVRSGSWKKHWEDVLLSALAIIAGGVVMARPILGLSAITLSLVVYFAASGFLQILWWWKLRRARGSIWMLLAGIATAILAVLIGREWPLSGLWAVGTLVGVHLLFTGTSLFALASPPKASPQD